MFVFFSKFHFFRILPDESFCSSNLNNSVSMLLTARNVYFNKHKSIGKYSTEKNCWIHHTVKMETFVSGDTNSLKLRDFLSYIHYRISKEITTKTSIGINWILKRSKKKKHKKRIMRFNWLINPTRYDTYENFWFSSSRYYTMHGKKWYVRVSSYKMDLVKTLELRFYSSSRI